MRKENLGPWALFLGGHWTKARPSRPGTYPVATREGVPLPPKRYRELVKREGKVVEADLAPGEPGWQAWWWSQPLPPIPTLAEEWSA